MQVELKKLQQALGITFIFVTHDQGEALSMSIRVAVFNNGRIEQVDTPRDLYLRPRTPFVAGFVGTANVFDAGLRENCAAWKAASLRPEHIRLNEGGEFRFRAWCRRCSIRGRPRLELKRDGANCWSARPISVMRGAERHCAGAGGAGVVVTRGDDRRWRRGEMTMSVASSCTAPHDGAVLAQTVAGPVPAAARPLMWFGIVYLGSLLTLLWQVFTPLTISPCRSRRI
jgi:energy-coupling factor transporter ATP-binding protein EcfA2